MGVWTFLGARWGWERYPLRARKAWQACQGKNPNWTEIAKQVPNRSPAQCGDHWREAAKFAKYRSPKPTKAIRK